LKQSDSPTLADSDPTKGGHDGSRTACQAAAEHVLRIVRLSVSRRHAGANTRKVRSDSAFVTMKVAGSMLLHSPNRVTTSGQAEAAVHLTVTAADYRVLEERVLETLIDWRKPSEEPGSRNQRASSRHLGHRLRERPRRSTSKTPWHLHRRRAQVLMLHKREEEDHVLLHAEEGTGDEVPKSSWDFSGPDRAVAQEARPGPGCMSDSARDRSARGFQLAGDRPECPE